MNIGFGMAFGAGALSFLSPCVLPLIPGYLALISGLAIQESSADDGAVLRSGFASAGFVLGFAVAFTALGALASEVTAPLTPHLSMLKKASSLLIIAFGLHMTGALPIHLRYAGPTGAFAMGLAFAFGWVPCIGPVLAVILALAAGESVMRGSALLFTYSLGLGVPFIAAGLAVSAFLSFFTRYRRLIRAGKIASGALLITVGGILWSRAA